MNAATESPIDGLYDEAFRDNIATVDENGNRLWVYPKQPQGRFYKYRTYVSWVLLTVLFILPFIKLNGEPLVLLNVLERRFIIFGLHFTPQDFYLFAILMITMVVFVALFTVIWGRLFCGWVCPQTIFMEMVFRKVEYWIEGDANAQKRLNKAPWTRQKITKKVGKQLVFLIISALIAHTFLSYIIGWEQVRGLISQPPGRDLVGFASMVIFTFVFYGVFAYMREQVCIAICPYGRLQGVLTGDDTMAVMYDFVRGEPRGKLQRGKKAKVAPAPKHGASGCSSCRDGACQDDPIQRMSASLSTPPESVEIPAEPALKLGDCIDCKLCVHVCPTAIDIRNGTQLECVNCTACIDACDEVMTKIGRPTGLIRYDSQNGIVDRQRKVWRPRVMAYSVVLLALISLNGFLLSNRSSVNATIVRTPGLLYQRNDDGSWNNLYKYQLVNKTGEAIPVEFRLAEGTEGQIRLVGDPPVAVPGEVAEGVFFIDQPEKMGRGRERSKLRVELWNGDQQLDQVRVTFMRPPE